MIAGLVGLFLLSGLAGLFVVLPVHAIRVGESAGDLRPFRADDFAESLLGVDGTAAEPSTSRLVSLAPPKPQKRRSKQDRRNSRARLSPTGTEIRPEPFDFTRPGPPGIPRVASERGRVLHLMGLTPVFVCISINLLNRLLIKNTGTTGINTGRTLEMRAGLPIAATVMSLLAKSEVAQAAFFGTFDPFPVPEPSSLSLFAVGGGIVAVVAYLRSRNRRK